MLFLDRQHAYKPDRFDVGAIGDLDGDGVVGEEGEREIDLTALYGDACASMALGTMAVTRFGWEPPAMSYDTRHATVGSKARQVTSRCAYLALHVNAPAGGYGLVRFDYRSRLGLELASDIVTELRKLPGLADTRVVPLYPSANAAGRAGRDVSTDGMVSWWTRGWSCIDGIYEGPANLAGVLVEPFFINGDAHRALRTPDGLISVGDAIAQGVINWRSHR